MSSSSPSMSNVFVFIDLDGTVCDYHAAINSRLADSSLKINLDDFWAGVEKRDAICKQIKDNADRQDHFYRDLKPYPGAIETIKELAKKYQVYFLSAPEVFSATCHSDKNDWIVRHFGREFGKRLILTSDKTLVGCSGGYNILIDDLTQRGMNDKPLWTQVYKINEYNKDKMKYPHIKTWDFTQVDSVLIDNYKQK